MFTQFESNFHRDGVPTKTQAGLELPREMDPVLKQLLTRYEGATFNNGIYRVMDAGTRHLSQEFVDRAFPKLSKCVSGFASDWLGRIFVVDLERMEAGSPGISMLEPGTGEALEIPCNLHDFHENELIESAEAALASSVYEEWLEQGGAVPAANQCIGYKKPLFLGGEDDFENLELSDLDVYWTLCAELIHRTRGLPPGAKIRGIDLH